MEKITYIFGECEKKPNNKVDYSNDFLYGYDYFLENNYDVNYIIASEGNNNVAIEKYLEKYQNYPFT